MKATLVLLSSSLISLGCAAEWPTSELVQARSAYRQASVSRAASFSQERLAQAKQALDRAEGAYAAAPGTPEARALAYVALRRAELAKVSGDYEFDKHVIAELRERKDRATTADAPVTTPAPPTPTEETAPAPGADTTASGEQNLAAQHDAAELATLVEALSGSEPLVMVKQEPRGIVIALDSSFLFVPKKAEILAGARDKLDRIARALTDLGQEKSIVVEGHTDSTGPDERNLELSKQRADALRNYLVGHGVAPDRVRATGRGEQAPIASNDTAEGRALNRRIEIVVSKTEEP